MEKLWYGQHLFVSDIENDEAINKIKELKIDGVIIKSHDGSKQVIEQFENLVSKFHDIGVKVGAWGYVYGDNTESEAERAFQSLNSGADWYIIDAEKEFKGKPDKAKSLINNIRNLKPDAFVAFTSFDIPQYHTSFPYFEFAKKCDLWMPQIFWSNSLDDIETRWKKAEEGYEKFIKKYNIPIMPVGQCADTNENEIKTFVEIVKPKGIAWWKWEQSETIDFKIMNEIEDKYF
jgi:hypothetical protein